MHKAKCKSCGQIIVSERPGHFASCDCGKSFIDTDRWFPERIRLGGDAEGREECIEMTDTNIDEQLAAPQPEE